MKGALLALLLWQGVEVSAGPEPGPRAEPRYMRYERAVTLPAGANGQGCATLDAAVYAHGAASLKDVRLYDGTREVPYAVTMSESAETESTPARVVNLGMKAGKIVFDLEMPDRAYTDVALELGGRNFLASAEVSGRDGAEIPVRLATFTLFDLSGQGLSRSTTLHLQESRFPALHVEMKVVGAPGGGAFTTTPAMVLGATVPPDREAQTVYTVVESTTAVTQEGRETVARFRLPARVPVERVSFVLGAGFAGNFSRGVEVKARSVGASPSDVEKVTGRIERVHQGEMRLEALDVPATLGANLQSEAEVEVRVANGDDAPVPLAAVRLEMRERRLCFPVAAGAMTLFYGDAALAAPVYDFARLFVPGTGVVVARLGAERLNAGYVARGKRLRSLTERHPEVLWVALLGVVCVLAVVATHSAKRVGR